MKSVRMPRKANSPCQRFTLWRTALILGTLLLPGQVALAQNNILELREVSANTLSYTLQGVVTQASSTAKTTFIQGNLWFNPNYVNVTFTPADLPGVAETITSNGQRAFDVASGPYQGSNTAYFFSMTLRDEATGQSGATLPPGTVFGTYTVTLRKPSFCGNTSATVGWTNAIITTPALSSALRSLIGTTPSASTAFLNGIHYYNPPNRKSLLVQVALEGIDPELGFTTLTLEFGPPTNSLTVDVGPFPTFMTCISQENSNQTVRVKALKWLAVRTELVPDPNNPDLLLLYATLRAGDANNDNAVDVFDFDLLIQSFNLFEGDPGFLEEADLNCDTSVDIFDFDLLIRNFNTQGDE